MPANLPPQYGKAEEEYRKAATPPTGWRRSASCSASCPSTRGPRSSSPT